MKRTNIAKYVFRVLLGILFLFSATAKLIGIDAFEIYIFSFGILPLGLSFLAARLVIAAEYILGILLIANFLPRLTFWGTFVMLAAFTAFLAVLTATGNHDNCNCFGELVDLSPAQSLWKNVAMLALLLPTVGLGAFKIRRKYLWLSLTIVIPLAAVLIVSPPDNWRYDSYAGSGINKEALHEALDNGILPEETFEGDKVVCFYSLKCRFCQMSARKIATLRSRGEFSRAPIVAVFGRGQDTDTAPFLEDTGLEPDSILFIEPSDFIRITNGSFPLILILREGEIVEQYNYRNLH